MVSADIAGAVTEQVPALAVAVQELYSMVEKPLVPEPDQASAL